MQVSQHPERVRMEQGVFGAALLVRVSLDAKFGAFVDSLAYGMLHVHLTKAAAEDVEGHLVHFLARVLDLYPEQIHIVDETPVPVGKVVAFYGITPEELERRIQEHLQGVPKPQ